MQQLQAEETAATVQNATALATAAVQEQANAPFKRTQQEMASGTELRKSHTGQVAESESKVIALEKKMSETRVELAAAEKQCSAEEVRKDSAASTQGPAAVVDTADKAARRFTALVDKMEDLEAKYEETLADKRRATLADQLERERAVLRREAISTEQYRRTTSKGRGAAGPFVRKIVHRVPVIRRNGTRRYARELVVWSDRVVAQDPEEDAALSLSGSPGRKTRRAINWHFDRIVSITAGSKRSKDREMSTKMTVVVKKCVAPLSLSRSRSRSLSLSLSLSISISFALALSRPRSFYTSFPLSLLPQPCSPPPLTARRNGRYAIKGVSSKFPVKESLAFDVGTRAACADTITAIHAAQEAYYKSLATGDDDEDY